jgi:glycine betaine/proline transport system substrate-binding protein
MLAAAALLFSGCGESAGGAAAEGEKESEKQEEKVIKVGLVNWADCIAMTNVVRVILEEEYGYTVETSYADVAVIFSSIAQGDYDLYTDMWLPVTHKTYMDEYGENLVKISTTFEGARIGLVVPSYVTIDSITELNDHKQKFDEQIVGIDTGAGIMKTTNKAIEEYGLDLELKASSGPVMTAALKEAIDKDEWVVVTGWKPHWKFARWDLKFLDDPQKLYGEIENTYAVGHTGFQDEFPEVTAFLENFLLTDKQLGEVIGLIADSEDKEAYQVAKEWVHDHPELVEEWTP